MSYSNQRLSSGRKIQVPDDDLKRKQRKWVKLLQHQTSISISSWGIYPERDVFGALRRHLGADYILKMDVKSFFPSVTREKFKRSVEYLRQEIGITPKLQSFLENHLDQCFYQNRLPTGAPTSPILADIAFRKTDSDIRSLLACGRIVHDRQIKYSRYVDDLIFSSKGSRNWGFIDEIEGIVRRNGFNINSKKTRFYAMKTDRPVILGLQIANGNLQASRGLRRRIRAAEHYLKFNPGDLSAKGLAAYGRTIKSL